ncbi:MAG TPA: alpha-L-arabinofuranosidase C-terminal domain-containing protein [Opitutaceae bacterium]|nr:alpha-L-arabinofuranosidase C-terminal domain-containing protein [Opitutaceae bacterium]
MKPHPSLLFFAAFALARAAQPTITIDAKPVGQVSPRLYGLMTEEINYSYDGGLYAELVRNRAFLDDAKQPAHWSLVTDGGAAAQITLDRGQPLNGEIPVSLRLDATRVGVDARAGIANTGYWGIPVRPRTTYRASFFAKAASAYAGTVTVSIESNDGQTTFATGTVTGLTTEWKQYEVELMTLDVRPTAKARYVVAVDRPGTVWFSFVSLFPPTWNDRPNGLRKDLMQKLVDLKPKFLRFPGGNYVEGNTIAERFDWKKTIGPISERPGHMSPWGYRSTDGMGLLEFLEWCEDMRAEPVLAVYAGYSLEGQRVAPGADLAPYVQDALDEIEYVTGDIQTKWGAERAKDGHPAPFPLHFVEIGNEDNFDKANTYDARFTQFFDAIKAKYPALQCISTVALREPAAKRVHSRTPDLIDEHYYSPVDEFLKMAAGKYDTYDRNGPKIFVGEWADYETPFPPWDKRSRQEPPTANLRAAVGDAAFMTDLERNSDLVLMHCYAPLFVNVNPGGRQWRPDLIGYDALRSYGSPSYEAFKLFSTHVGDQLMKVTRADTPLLVSATRSSASGKVYVKLVNPEPTAQAVTLDFPGVNHLGTAATVLTLTGPSPEATNTMDAPMAVAPVATAFSGVRPGFSYSVPGNGIVVLILHTD